MKKLIAITFAILFSMLPLVANKTIALMPNESVLALDNLNLRIHAGDTLSVEEYPENLQISGRYLIVESGDKSNYDWIKLNKHITDLVVVEFSGEVYVKVTKTTMKLGGKEKKRYMFLKLFKNGDFSISRWTDTKRNFVVMQTLVSHKEVPLVLKNKKAGVSEQLTL